MMLYSNVQKKYTYAMYDPGESEEKLGMRF